jgi:chromosome segregation ATPase
MLSAVLLGFAVIGELLFLGYDSATLIALFSALPMLQKIVWLVICFAPLFLFTAALVQHRRLRGMAAGFKARLRGIRLDVRKLEEAQKDTDHATQYMELNDPEDAMNALQARLKRTEKTIQSHQQRDQSNNLTGRVEEMRQQQQQLRDKLGQLTTQRSSLLEQVQSCQNDLERAVAGIERDQDGDQIETRLQKVSEFIRATNSRCDQIEDSLPSLVQLQQKLSALEMRIAPLDDKETGISSTLKAVSNAASRLAITIERLEQDEGVTLVERIRQLSAHKRELDERVSSVLTQFSEIETIHRDMNGLFARLNKAQQPAKHFEGVIPINFMTPAE